MIVTMLQRRTFKICDRLCFCVCLGCVYVCVLGCGWEKVVSKKASNCCSLKFDAKLRRHPDWSLDPLKIQTSASKPKPLQMVFGNVTMYKIHSPRCVTFVFFKLLRCWFMNWPSWTKDSIFLFVQNRVQTTSSDSQFSHGSVLNPFQNDGRHKHTWERFTRGERITSAHLRRTCSSLILFLPTSC